MEEKEAIQKFRTEIVPGFAHRFAQVLVQLPHKDNCLFKEILDTYVSGAIKRFCRLVGVKDIARLTRNEQSNLMVEIVSQFNEALPIDYPYLVMAVKIENEKGMYFGAIKKIKIPGSHEMTSRGVVPIFYVKSREAFESSQLKISAEWFGADDNQNLDPA